MVRRWTGLGLLCATVAIAGAACRRGTTEGGFDGAWVMRVEGEVLMVLRLDARGEGFVGTFSRPQRIQTDGRTFSGLSADVVTERIISAARQGKGLRVVVENSQNKGDKTAIDLLLNAPNDLSVKPAGAPFEAWHFTRHEREPRVATNWDAAQTYVVRERGVTPNSEMAAIFEQDQAARQSPDTSPERWKVISQEDAGRRARTRTLLERGQLKAAADFRKAAFIFQHGDAPDDYLLAHSLALVALAKGDPTAGWIAAATLDRYLNSIGKPQIYGTQFSVSGPLKEPYNRALIDDLLRRSLNVPPLAEQGLLNR